MNKKEKATYDEIAKRHNRLVMKMSLLGEDEEDVLRLTEWNSECLGLAYAACVIAGAHPTDENIRKIQLLWKQAAGLEEVRR